MGKRMGDKIVYDLCIVGSGLIGSSAARHATSGQTALKVCVIGPDEPQNRESTDIFGSWYDEGRIARSTASDTLWAQLAARSIARYRDVEKRTGIRFYEEVGCLTIGPEHEEFLRNTYKSAQDMKMQVSKLNAKETTEMFPYIKMGPGAGSVFENQDAGYVNPRTMREAQLTAAHLQGCDIIKDIVQKVQEITSPDGSKVMQVTTDGGSIVLSRKVLLAVGCFSEFRNLLPKGIVPHILAKGQTVIFAEVDPKDLPKLRKMPSIIYKHGMLDFEGATNEKDKYNCYILPPIKYPDSNSTCYVKLGSSTIDKKIEPDLSTVEDVREWFKSKPPEIAFNSLLGAFRLVFSGFEPVSFWADTCVTSHTPTRRPYIELITPNLGVALGGNGYAAKSCDEIGKIAVEYVLSGNWTYDWPKESFKFVAKPKDSKL